MVFNETIAYGNISVPVVSTFTKVDAALDGGLTFSLHVFIFLAITIALFKRDRRLERGIAVAGFTTGILGVFFTIIGYLSWNYIWMSISLFVMAFIAKNMEKQSG